MSVFHSTVSVVLTGDTDARALRQAIVELALAIQVAESGGVALHNTIIGDDTEPAVRQLFEAIEGANLLPRPGTLLDAVGQALSDSGGDFVWLGAAGHAVPLGNFVWLLAAMEPADVSIAIAEHQPITQVLIRRSALDRLGKLGDLPLEDPNSHEQIAQALIDAFRDAGERCAYRLDPTINGSEDTRPRTPSPGLQGAEVLGGWNGSTLIGAHVYAGYNASIRKWHHDVLVVNDYTSIAERAAIIHPGYGQRNVRDETGVIRVTNVTGGHHLETATTFPVQYLSADTRLQPDESTFGRPLVVGPDCWIGFGALVSGPLRVGAGAVVAAGSVVLQDVPPYAVVAGNPAKVVRMRFSQDVIDALLRIRWWDWPSSLVAERWRDFTIPINEFVEKYDLS